MSRFPQPTGTRGSQKWIQQVINERPHLLNRLILPHIPNISAIEWLSPLASDDFAEYRDRAFLERVGIGRLSGALAEFWPTRGPQWDALGKTDKEGILLVEAKAHISEVCSPPTHATGISRQKIEQALGQTISSLGAKPCAPWTDVFYQYANRLAHLHFLRTMQNQSAWLVFVYFVGDSDMEGPATEGEWRAALTVIKRIMGLSERNELGPFVLEVFPRISNDEK
jgi:hypothetical protein